MIHNNSVSILNLMDFIYWLKKSLSVQYPQMSFNQTIRLQLALANFTLKLGLVKSVISITFEI